MGRAVYGLLSLVATMVLRTTSGKIYELTVEKDHSDHTTDELFLSVALGGGMCARLDRFQVDNPKLNNLVEGLGRCVARIGGMAGNFNIISRNKQSVTKTQVEVWEDQFHKDFWEDNLGRNEDWRNRNCTANDTATVFNFFHRHNWPITYQVNHMLQDRRHRWSPHNTNLLLQYLDEHGVDVEYFQLTNEPNNYEYLNLEEDVEKVVNDFKIFKNYLDTQAPQRFRNSKIVGPDTSAKGGKRSYILRVMDAGLQEYIDILGIHLYYIDGRFATVQDFLNATLFDYGQQVMTYVNQVAEEYSFHKPIYFSESASAFAGGAPNISNRYVGSLVWLDELGLSAKNGIARINRQTLWSGAYSLLEFRDYEPNPNYWVSKLYKDLIEGPVLNTTMEPPHNDVRIYAHCARHNGPYNPPVGAVVVYGINLRASAQDINISQFGDSHDDLILSRKTRRITVEESLVAIDIKVNDVELKLNGTELPEIPTVSNTGPISVPKYGMFFAIFKDADVAVCRDYWSS